MLRKGISNVARKLLTDLLLILRLFLELAHYFLLPNQDLELLLARVLDLVELLLVEDLVIGGRQLVEDLLDVLLLVLCRRLLFRRWKLLLHF